MSANGFREVAPRRRLRRERAVRLLLGLLAVVAALGCSDGDGGGAPSSIDPNAAGPYAVGTTAFYERVRAERYLVEIFRTGHFAFSNLCASSTNPTGSNFPECAAGTLTQDEAHAFVVRFALPFLLRRVANDDRFAALLDPASAPAGTQLISDPAR